VENESPFGKADRENKSELSDGNEDRSEMESAYKNRVSIQNVKLSTLDSIYPRARNLETLEPKEKVEMMMCKQRMTFLLQIFYQWRSITKLGLN
jgi:hypothetical protein